MKLKTFKNFSINDAYKPPRFENQEERDFYNFVARFERALNKFLNTPNIDNKKNKYNKSYTYVSSYFNEKPYPIAIILNSYSPEAELLIEYLKETSINNFIAYYLTMDQAEELLKELKTNFSRKIALKYNL